MLRGTDLRIDAFGPYAGGFEALLDMSTSLEHDLLLGLERRELVLLGLSLLF